MRPDKLSLLSFLIALSCASCVLAEIEETTTPPPETTSDASTTSESPEADDSASPSPEAEPTDSPDESETKFLSMDYQKPSFVFFAKGEFLYWRPDQAGMTYVLTSSGSGGLTLGSTNKEIHQSSKYGPGFRIGIGMEQTSNFDAGIYWTDFNQTTHSSISSPTLLATQMLGSPTSPVVVGGSTFGAGQPRSKWRLRYSFVEGVLGGRITSNEDFLLRAYAGVIGGHIKQRQTINYDNFFDLTNSVFLNAEVKQKNNFHGVGPKFGLSTHYRIMYGLGILTDISASFLYGKASNPVTTTVLGDPAGFPVSQIEVAYKQNRILPLLQGKLGIDWEVFVADLLYVSIGMQYEIQYVIGTWRNQSSSNQNLYTSDAGYSNLTLQGLTASLSVGF